MWNLRLHTWAFLSTGLLCRPGFDFLAKRWPCVCIFLLRTVAGCCEDLGLWYDNMGFSVRWTMGLFLLFTWRGVTANPVCPSFLFVYLSTRELKWIRKIFHSHLEREAALWEVEDPVLGLHAYCWPGAEVTALKPASPLQLWNACTALRVCHAVLPLKRFNKSQWDLLS